MHKNLLYVNFIIKASSAYFRPITHRIAVIHILNKKKNQEKHVIFPYPHLLYPHIFLYSEQSG